MARSSTDIKITLLIVALGLPLVLPGTALAATAGVSNVENFIRSIITVFAGLAGLVATGFLVAGGFTYITSSGNPEHLDRAKRTITYALIGLAITIGAFVISNIVTTLASSAFGG
jgi:cytochrome bd-type quinol oxidase subunit 2